MKRIFELLFCAALLLAACEKLEEKPRDSANTINGITCYVYYDAADLTKKETLDVLATATVNEQMGLINYTFPAVPELYNAASLTRCRLEIAIPSTAHILLTDNDGNPLGGGIGGQMNLLNTTVCFTVVAADGSPRLYKVTFRLP